MFSKLGPIRHFDFPEGGHQFINYSYLPMHVPGVNFPPNPSFGPIMFLNFSILLGFPRIIVTWDPVYNSTV